MLSASLSHDLGPGPASQRLPRGQHHSHLLRGGSPSQPQLLGEGRRDGPPERALPPVSGEGHSRLQGKHDETDILLDS